MEVLKGLGLRDVVKPPDGYNPRLAWTFGQDRFSNPISERLGYRPSNQELQLIVATANRRADTVYRLTGAEGRRASFSTTPVDILSTPYNCLEIGGYGNCSLTIKGNEVAEISKDPIQLPSEKNFNASHPTIVITQVVEGIKVNEKFDPFSFTGAYTKDQAVRKVASALFFLDKLSQESDPLFTVPLPVAIGQYPSITEPTGEVAHFIAWRVPYEGKRQGMFKFGQPGRELVLAISKIGAMAGVLRFIHDTYGLTHNQTTLGNYYIPPSEGLPYLADLSVIHPISKARPQLSRAHDLAQLIARGMAVTQLAPEISYEGLLDGVFKNCVSHYFKARPDVKSPTKEGRIRPLLENVMQHAVRAKLIPTAVPTDASWKRIQTIKAELDKILAANV